MSSISTKKAKQKLAQARKGEINLPSIAGIALGDGGESNGELKTPLAENVSLFHELIRKPYSACTKISDTSYRYRIDLEAEELAGKVINEMALYDADGDLIAIRTFIGKPKDADIEMAFEFDDIFLGGVLMSYFEEDGSTYDNQIRKIKEDDLATALLLNTLVQSLVNNDAFIKSIIEKHLANRENPHNVSKKQLMLENVDNTSDLNKPVSLAVQDAFDTYYEQLAGYTDQAIGDLINGAPETLNTLKEVADAIAEHKSVQEALNAAIGKKANAEEFDSHTKAMATSTVPGHVKVDTALSSTSTNAVQNKVINAALDKKLDKTGDSKDNTVTFTSNDALNPTAYTDVNALASGEKHSSILNKISTMFKNIRYLYKLLGNHTIESNVPPNAKFTDNNTWNAFEGATSTVAGTAGYVPAPTAGDATRYFRSDGTWAVPPNQTYQNFIKSGTGAKAGLVPEPPTTAGTGKYLREDGTWATPPDNDTKTTVENVLTSTNTKNALSAAQGKVLQGEIDDINSNLQIIKSGTAVVSGVFSDYFRFINIHFDKPFNEVPIVVLTLVGNTALIIERAEVFGITEDQFTVFVTYQDGAAKDTTRPNREVKWIAIGK